MFDLALLRKPTFIGGLIAAFAISASLFSLLTYLVLYLQNVPRLLRRRDRRALPVALRRRSSSPPAIAGRLTSMVPAGLADRAGLRRCSASGLLLMRGIEPDVDAGPT